MDKTDNMIVLPDGYHLDNFQHLINHALAVYEDLLRPEELNWIQNFQSLTSSSQSLYVRLVMRKGPYFRTDNLNYKDIPDLHDTMEQLANIGFINLLPDHSIHEVLRLCLKKELQSIAKRSTDIDCKLSKPDLIDALSDALSEDEIKFHLSTLFTWIERNNDDIVKRLQLLFFANGRQSLTEFITHQLGIIQYENYPINGEYRFFQSRERLELLEQLTLINDWQEQALREASVESIETVLTQLLAIKHHCTNNDFYIERKTAKSITHVARQLERLSPERAQTYYRESNSPPSRERQARILVQQGDFQSAHELIIDIETNPKHPDEPDKLKPLKKKVMKALNFTPQPEKERHYLEQNLTLVQNEGNIEQLVANYLSDHSAECFHLENQLFLGLFGLFFWDIIFSPCKDAFYNAYQFGPRDLWEDGFYLKRKDKFDERIVELFDPPKWHQRVLSNSASKRGLANYLVNWQALDDTMIAKLCRQIPGDHLAIIFKQMLKNLGYFRNGFPDLVLLNQNGYHLWEVKGPTDTLQTNQKRWLDFFQDNDIPAGVIYVQWQQT